MTTDNTQELDEILFRFSVGKIDEVMASVYPKEVLDKARQDVRDNDPEYKLALEAILDWHNKQVEEVLNEMLVDVSSPSANIDQAEMIELINLYINKLKNT